MTRVRFAGRVFDAGRLRSLATVAAGLALGGGLALGVASAAPSGAVGSEVAPGPQPPQPPQSAARPGLLQSRPALKPLHQLLLARAAQRAQSQARVAAGRVLQIGATALTVQTGPGQTRIVRISPETRLPARRVQPGDQILAVGQPAADGSLAARAIAARPAPGPAARVTRAAARRAAG